MNQQELIKSIEATYAAGLELIKVKNNDYADPSKDAFKNFRMSELIGIDPKRAILVRMCDKLARISNLLDREGLVLDESVADTLIDLCNYGAILKAMIESEAKPEENKK